MKVLGWMAVFAFSLIPLRAFFLVTYKIYLGLPFDEEDVIALAMGAFGIWIAMVVYRTLVAPKRERTLKKDESPKK